MVWHPKVGDATFPCIFASVSRVETIEDVQAVLALCLCITIWKLQWPSNDLGSSWFLVHGQVTIIFIVSVGLSVCLFICAEFFSAVFDPILIKLGHMLFVWV